MIKKSLLLAAALAGVAVTSNAFAYTPTESNNASPAAKPRPIPASVVSPTGLPRSFMGSVVNVEFTLDPAGQPHDIKVLRVNDPILSRQLVAAVSQWRFDSSGSQAAARTQRYILPIELRPGA